VPCRCFPPCRDRRVLAERRLEGLFGIVAHEGQLDLVARLEGVDAAGEVSGIFDRLPVQQNAKSVAVTMIDGKTLDAEVVGGDARTDIAVLKVRERGDYPY
jgi:hypothetical protein